MNQQISMSDFFGMEASDYLEKLDRMVAGSSRPETNDFVRLARALRGSAMMASQRKIAEAAGALEIFARALHETRIEWDAGNRQLAISTVDDLKMLVRRLSSWTPEDDHRITALTAELTAVAGTAPAPARGRDSGLDTGTRAFIGREGSAVASALQRASQTAAAGRTPPEVSDSILQAIQPLRGIASLTDVPPLPDLLDGLDRIATECKRHPDRTIANLKEIFSAAAEAIARVARQVAASGAPDPASEEAARFARLLRTAFEGEGAVIPIEDLFFDDAGPHIVSRGAAPDVPQLRGVELVAHSEHLRLAADQLDSSITGTQRDLRLQALEARLVSLATLQDEGVASAVSALARKLQVAIADIGADGDTAALIAQLRDAAGILATAATASEDELAAALRDATAAPDEFAPGPSAGPPLDLQPTVTTETAAEGSARGEPVAPLAEGAAGVDLAASFATFESLLAQLGPGTPSLDDLVAGPPVVAVRPAAPLVEEHAIEEHAIGDHATPVATTAPEQPRDTVPESAIEEPAGESSPADDLPLFDVEYLPEEPLEEPAAVTPTSWVAEADLPPIEDFLVADQPGIVPQGAAAARADEDLAPIEEFLVPVTDFCYEGREALKQALALKSDLRELLDSDHPERAADLLVEVLDLIELGLGSEN